MWTLGEEQFHVQHALHGQIAGVKRLARYFIKRVNAG
jgi:hypothetical protein